MPDEDEITPTGTVHNLRHRYWGHSIEAMSDPDEKHEQRVCVFLSARIVKGDVIETVTAKGNIAQLLVINDPRRPMDPGDQHFMMVRRIG